MRCRLCAAQCNNNAANLFENEANAELNKKIAKYLHVHIETNDPFSSKVCVGCVKNLESFHIFYCLIEEKQGFIHSKILDMVTVKDEPPDEKAIIREPYHQNFESQRTEPLDSISLNKSDNAMEHIEIKKEDNAETSQFSISYDISENEMIIKNEHFSDEEEIETMEDTEYIVSNEAETKDAKNKQSYQEHSNNCFTCRVCGYVSLSFEDSKTHYNKDHNTAFKDVYIICCGLRFYTQKPFDDHRNSPPSTFRCDICNKQLLCAKTLHFHKMAKHTDRQEYKYSCEICGERFMFLCALKEHIPTHTTKKPFKCDTCGQCYASLSYLRSHKNRHSANKLKTKLVFDCEHCRKEFTCDENFRAHLLLNENNDCLRKNARSMEREVTFYYKVENKCCLCNKVFKKKNILQKHLDVHMKRMSRKKFPLIKKLGSAAIKDPLDSSNIFL